MPVDTDIVYHEKPDDEIWISASQIDTWLACPAKWGFAKIAQVEREDTEMMTFGKDAHDILFQHGMGTRLPPDSPEGRAAQAVIVKWHVPHKEPGIFYEGLSSKGETGPHVYPTERGGMFKIPLPEVGPKVYIIGYTDQDDERDKYHSQIKDYKFTSDAKWAKTRDMLYTDPQCLIYVHYARTAYNKSCATFTLIYCEVKMRKGGRKATKVFTRDITFARNDPAFEAGWERVIEAAKEIAAKQPDKTIHDAEGQLEALRIVNTQYDKKTEHCPAYNGCDFGGRKKRLCKHEKGAGIRGAFNTQRRRQVGLIDKVRAEKAAAAKNKNTPADTPAAQVKAKAKAKVTEEKTDSATKSAKKLNAALATMNRSKKRNQVPATPQRATETETPAEPAAAPPEPETTSEAAPVKRKRGRPRKVKATETETETASAAALASTEKVAPTTKPRAVTPAAALPAQPAAAPTQPAAAGMTMLCVDCVPTFGTAEPIESVLKDILFPDGQTWDYPCEGAHYVDLRAGVRSAMMEFMAAGGLNGRVLLVSSQSETWSLFGHILAARCNVIKGTR